MTQSHTLQKPNIFNDYFGKIAEKVKVKVRFSSKAFDEVLQHTHKKSFFLKPIGSEEIINLISSLNKLVLIVFHQKY